MTPAQHAAIAALFETACRELKVTPAHPVLPLPTSEHLEALLDMADGLEQLVKKLLEREELIRLMAHDPLHHGYQPDWWKDATELLDGGRWGEHDEILVLGGNDSTKSWYLARSGVATLRHEFGVDVAFLHNTEDSSKRQQQGLVHRYLPPTWRDMGKVGRSINVTFHEKTGFTDNAFVLPNKSRGFFFFYKQEAGILTGYKLRRAVYDELMPLSHLEELRTRMLGRGGKIIGGFTPTEGYTPVVQDLVAGAKILETRPAKFLPGKNFENKPEVPVGHMPYILQSRRPNAAVLFAFTESSPFRKPGDLEKMIASRSKAWVMIRAYGYAEKTVGNAFPKFSERVNVLTQNPAHDWNRLGVVPPHPWQSKIENQTSKILYPGLPATGTNRVVADPGGSKNWFIKWYRAGADPDFHYVYREWPPQSTHGPWAEPAKSILADVQRQRWDGYQGPAQRYDFDPSIVRYKKLILEAEGWVWDDTAGKWDGTHAEEIYERLIDPRMGGATVPSEEDGTSIIIMMEEEQYDQQGRLVGPSMVWVPAPGGGRSVANLTSLEIFNSYFHYDLEKPLSVLNCPKWYVVDACEQSIFAYKEYTGQDGEKGMLKDVLDPDWYYVKSEPDYIGEAALAIRSGTQEEEED